MKKLIIFSAVITCMASCQIFKYQRTEIKPDFSQVEHLGSFQIPSEKDTSDLISSTCNIQGIHYSHKKNALFLIQSDKSMEQRNKFYVLNLDKNKTRLKDISSVEIKSQNGQSIYNIIEYSELINKGKKPKYNIFFFNDIAYDDKNEHIIILNSGTRWSYKDISYSTNPSIFSLSNDNRLLGQFSISKLLKSPPDSSVQNTNFEILTIAPSHEKVFSMTSEPINSERPQLDSYDTGFVRISAYRAASKSEEGQYLYPLHFPNDPYVIEHSDSDYKIINAISANDSTLWVLEGLELKDLTWTYNMYEVILSKNKKLTSSKSIYDLKKKPILQKKLLFNLNKVLPASNIRLKDLCWGPTLDKKQTMYFLVENNCETDYTAEIIQVKLN